MLFNGGGGEKSSLAQTTTPRGFLRDERGEKL